MNFENMKTIGICAHSYEGGSLCFLTACRRGADVLGPHMHPNIVLSAIPMGLSMAAWESDDYAEIGRHLAQGIDQVAKGGADFFVCPDNTGHIVLEKIMDDVAIPGLHIADVVCHEIVANGWSKIGLLGTNWTMTGTVYPNVLAQKALSCVVPDETTRAQIDKAIFQELCQGIFKQETITLFQRAIEDLKANGAQCVILGCTEIPLIIHAKNSTLPVLDSTRLLATHAVNYAMSDSPLPKKGWIRNF